jgi:hypothetical protein
MNRTAVTIVRDRAHLAALARQWKELAPYAIDTRDSEAWRFVLVWIEHAGHSELGALFPFHGPALYKGFPVLALTSHRRAQPLIKRGSARACLEALFDWFSRDGEGARFMQLRDVPCQGEIYAALGDIARHRDQMVLSSEPVFRDGRALQTLLVGEGAWDELTDSGLPLLRWAKRSVAGIVHKTHVGTRRRGIFNHL